MTEVTKEMILDYLIKKGGVVKNVDLVRHFRKYLQVENPDLKDRAREVFKERVNSVASIKADKGEKYLYLRPEFQSSATAARPPTGRTGGVPSQTGFTGGNRTSVGSVEDPRHSLQSRDSLTQLISDLLSPTSTTSNSNFTDFGSPPPPSSLSHNSSSYSVSRVTPTRGGRVSEPTMFSSHSTKNDIVQSHKHFSASEKQGSVTTPTTTPSRQVTSSSASSSGPYSSPYATTTTPSSSTTTNNLANSANSSLFGPSSSSGLGDLGLGSLHGTSSSSGLGDLMSTFDNIFSSFGTSTGTSGLGGTGTNGLGGTDMSLGELGGLSTTSENSSKYDTPPAKSNASYSSTTTTTPQVSTSAFGQGQRSQRRPPPVVPPSSNPPLVNQTPSTGLTGSTSSLQQGSPRRPPPGPPSNRTSVSSIGSGGGVAGGVASSTSSMKHSTSGSLSSQQSSPRRPPPGPPTTGSGSVIPNTGSIRRAPPPAPSPKTSTSSVGGGASPSRNIVSNNNPPRAQSSSALPSYHAPSQQQQPSPLPVTPSKLTSPAGVTPPPKPSPSKITSAPNTLNSYSPNFSSSIGGVGSFDLRDFSNSLSLSSSFLAPSKKPDAPVAVSPPVPPQSSTGGSSILSAHSDPSRVLSTTARPSVSSSNYAPSLTGPSAVGSSNNAPSTLTYSGSGGRPINISSQQSSQLQLGPSITTPVGRGGVVDGCGRRQHSIDRTLRQCGSSEAIREMTPPTIRVQTSPPRGSPDSSGMSSPGRGRSNSPSWSSLSPPFDGRMRSQTTSTSISHVTNGNVTNNLISSLGVQLRNKQRVSQGSSVRRSRNLDKNPNVDSRLSIHTTPPTSRRNKPDVAPKPSPKLPHHSREDVSVDGDDVSIMSEQESWEIDPLEKDWMLASAQADLHGLQQLLLEEPNLINRKDFIHGYTALHWAAKHGRCDIIACLMLNQALVDIKSNGGLTPLHLAALSGYDNAIEQLISDFGANVNVRDHGGRRPIDILNNRVNKRARSLLCQINNHGLPIRVYTPDHLLTFSQPHQKDGGLHRNWSSLGDMLEKRVVHEKSKRPSRIASIRQSFRIHSRKKDYSPSKKEKSKRSSVRPVSVATSYNV